MKLFVVAIGGIFGILAYRGKRRLRRRIAVRASFDIGSGATKMTVASVFKGTSIGGGRSKILHVHFSKQTEVLLRSDLNTSGDSLTLGEGILSRCEATIKGFKRLATKFGATEYRGIATAVFRKARNGREFLKRRVEREMNIPVDIIDQKTEGEIGWRTAVMAYSVLSSSDNAVRDTDIVSWDSGGGSFQIVDAQGRLYGAHHGSATATAMMLDIQGKNSRSMSSPNPVSRQDALRMVARMTEEIPDPRDTWLEETLTLAETRVVSVGGPTCAFRIATIAVGRDEYTPLDLERALGDLYGCSDEDLRDRGFPQARMVLPKVCLLLAVMRSCKIPRVRYVPTNGSTLGLLVTEALWV